MRQGVSGLKLRFEFMKKYKTIMLGRLLTSITLLLFVLTECTEPTSSTDASTGNDDETTVDNSSEFFTYELIGPDDVRLKFKKEKTDGEENDQEKNGQKNDSRNNDTKDSNYFIDFEIIRIIQEGENDDETKKEIHAYLYADDKYFLRADVKSSELVFVKQDSVIPELAKIKPPSLSSDFVFLFKKEGRKNLTIKHGDLCVISGDNNMAMLGKCDEKKSRMALVSSSGHIFEPQSEKETKAGNKESVRSVAPNSKTPTGAHRQKPVEEEVVKRTKQTNLEGFCSTRCAPSQRHVQGDNNSYGENTPFQNKGNDANLDGETRIRKARYNEVGAPSQRVSTVRSHPEREEQNIGSSGTIDGMQDNGHPLYAPGSRQGTPYIPQKAPSDTNNSLPPPPADRNNPPPQVSPNPPLSNAHPQPNPVGQQPPSYNNNPRSPPLNANWNNPQPRAPPNPPLASTPPQPNTVGPNQPPQPTQGSPPSWSDPSKTPTAPAREPVNPLQPQTSGTPLPSPPQPSPNPQVVTTNEQPVAPPQPQEPQVNNNPSNNIYTQPPSNPTYDVANQSQNAQQAPPPASQSQPSYQLQPQYQGTPPPPPDDSQSKPEKKSSGFGKLFGALKGASEFASTLAKKHPIAQIASNAPELPKGPSFPF